MNINLDLEIRRIIGLHEILESNQLQLRPMIICYGQGRQLGIAACREIEQGNDRQREKAFKEILSLIGSMPKADEVLFASDAWTASYTTDEIDSVQVRPSEDPNHHEILSFVLSERETPSSLQYRWTPYVRDNSGQPYYLHTDNLRSIVETHTTHGMIPRLLSHIWDVPEPEFSLVEHCRALRDMGHLAWPCDSTQDDVFSFILNNFGL